MNTKRNISSLLNGLFLLSLLLFLLDEFTSFDIKNQIIKSFTYFGILILPLFILTLNLWDFKRKNRNLFYSILPILTLIYVLIIGPEKILYASSSWKTQKILYQNGHLNFNKVEFQIQDIGSFGYNKRTVEVIYLTSLFMIVSPVETDIQKRVEWIKVNKDVNELGLKLP